MKKILSIVVFLFLSLSYIHAQKPEYIDEKTFKVKVFNYETNKNWKYEGNTPAIVDFYADWCGPCKYVAPFLEQLASEYGTKIVVYKVNTDNNPNVSRAFNIEGIPAFLFIPAKGEPKMMVGAMAKSEFEKEITNFLKVTK